MKCLRLLLAGLTLLGRSASQETQVLLLSETVGDTIGIALAGGAVLVQAVLPPFPPKSESWCVKHVSAARSSKGFTRLSSRIIRPEEDAVYALPLLNNNLRVSIVAEAERTAIARENGWTTHRHDTYPTRDLPVSLLINRKIVDRVYAAVKETVVPTIATLFDMPVEQITIKDIFVVKYDASGDQEYRGLVQHTDSSAFSFNALLSDPSDFTGGGTSFEFLGNASVALSPAKGSAILHRGALEHTGVPITSGLRYILIGFLGQTGNSIGADKLSPVFHQTLSKHPAARQQPARENVDA